MTAVVQTPRLLHTRQTPSSLRHGFASWLASAIILVSTLNMGTLVATLPGAWSHDRLVGLVVKASVSKAEDPVFESNLR